MGLNINKKGNESSPTPVIGVSRKDFKLLLRRESLADRAKRLSHALRAHQIEIEARYREVAARYQEVLELRWVFLKAQCMEQARQLFGTHLSHVVYDTVFRGIEGIRDSVGVRAERATLVVSIHCVNRRAGSSDSTTSLFPAEETPLSQHPTREQQMYELELLDGCLAATLKERPQWMPQHLVLEIFDWQSGDGSNGINNTTATETSRCVSRRRAEVCRGTFNACAAMRKETQAQLTEAAKVSDDTASICNNDSGIELCDEVAAAC
ncbi:hypothetical protein PG999_011963 [Apiospora kogelbergensis]|uniref:Uncharacterized protein n=1 Tax=Apiospora kogelbergensis TaxID=1337665 RepID=A0AAW0QH60_9PEZI